MTRPTLETERLMLRPFALSDAAVVRKLAGDHAIADTTLRIPHPYEEGMAEEWISSHQVLFDEGKGVHLAITLEADRSLLGAVTLMDVVTGHQAELGYWIGKPYWNLGYCTEAAAEVIRFGFQELQLVRIHACHIARNPASGRVLRKLGMTLEGCRRKHLRKWDKLEDVELYAILEEEWHDRK